MNIKNDFYYQPTKLTRYFFSSVMAVLLTQVSVVALADTVKMYSQVPSANEMANHLFPKQLKRVTTRTISFDPIESIPQPVAKSVGIGLPIQFDFNSDAITRDSRPYINELGKMLSRKELGNEKIVIEGHTDATGSSQYNKKLSMRRAETIKHYLFHQYGIDRNRMIVSGKGEYNPLRGKNPYAAVNRRVEIHKYQ